LTADVLEGSIGSPAAPVVQSSKHMRIVWLMLALHAIAFLCFYPRALTIYDEVFYVRQAVAFSAGHATINISDPVTGTNGNIVPSMYPPGASILMTPLVWLSGWRATFLLGLLSVSLAVLCTARWIAESGGSPLYALVILGYVPTLIMSRTAMSDVPSAFLVALGLWMFWDNGESHPWRRFLAGFIAGVSACLRDVNPLLFAFFFAGALLRRERRIWALVTGGLTGVGFRLLASYLVYGDPLFVTPHPAFTGEYFLRNLLIYSVALLVLAPGGLVCVFGYRGRRWPELICTVVTFMLLFVMYDYSAAASGGLKQWILAPRMFIPLLPILAFAMAHTAPIWLEAFARFMNQQHALVWKHAGKVAVAIWLVAVGGIGWKSIALYRQHEGVVSALYSRTDPDRPILTDIGATIKFLNEIHGPRMVARLPIAEREIEQILYRFAAVDIVVFSRDDSAFWAQLAAENQPFINALDKKFSVAPVLEQRFPDLGVLQIWQLTRKQ